MTDKDKRSLYVGGLDDSVQEKDIWNLFLPFGDLREVKIPLDERTQKHRGFAFVDFEEGPDAFQAMDNLNNAEFFGKVLRINFAKPDSSSNRAIWEHSDYHTKVIPEAQMEKEEDGNEVEAAEVEEDSS